MDEQTDKKNKQTHHFLYNLYTTSGTFYVAPYYFISLDKSLIVFLMSFCSAYIWRSYESHKTTPYKRCTSLCAIPLDFKIVSNRIEYVYDSRNETSTNDQTNRPRLNYPYSRELKLHFNTFNLDLSKVICTGSLTKIYLMSDLRSQIQTKYFEVN